MQLRSWAWSKRLTSVGPRSTDTIDRRRVQMKGRLLVAYLQKRSCPQPSRPSSWYRIIQSEQDWRITVGTRVCGAIPKEALYGEPLLGAGTGLDTLRQQADGVVLKAILAVSITGYMTNEKCY